MKKRNNANLGWDELDDIDEMLDGKEPSALVDVDIRESKREKQTSKKNNLDSDSFNRAENIAADANGKKRRRSELAQVGADTEIPLMGYSQRSKRLNDGQELAIDDAQVSEGKTEFNRLFAKGVFLLGMREHSIKEMTDKLNAKSEMPDIVLAVVDELLENKFLSDERFAESYVRSRQNRGFGPIKIRAELHTKGISNRLSAENLDANSPHWFDVAREQYQKKYALKPLDNYKEWAKRARFMQSRGFNMEHIQAVMPSSDFY